VVAGRYLLNPFFRLLAWTEGARGDDGRRAARRARRFAFDAVVGHVRWRSAPFWPACCSPIDYRTSWSRHRAFPWSAACTFFMGVGMTIDMKIVGEPVADHRGGVIITLLRRAWSGRCSASPVQNAARHCSGSVLTGRVNSPSCCCRSARRSHP